MHKLGLKLWSGNLNYLTDALKLADAGDIQYIELYLVPGTENRLRRWMSLKVPFILHAPHDINLSQISARRANLKLLGRLLKAADLLKAKRIILHPGMNGEEEEIPNQLGSIRDPRWLIENLPFRTIDGKGMCNGHTTEQIRRIMKLGKTGFCLDIGHAISSANSFKQDIYACLRNFLSLKPALYHLSDGNVSGELDRHFHLGQGTYNLKHIVRHYLPANAMVTLETQKDSPDHLNDFREDLRVMRSFQRRR